MSGMFWFCAPSYNEFGWLKWPLFCLFGLGSDVCCWLCGEEKNPFTLWKGMRGDMEYLSFTQRARGDSASPAVGWLKFWSGGFSEETSAHGAEMKFTPERVKHRNSPAFVWANRQSSGCLKEKWQFVSSSNLVKYTLRRGNTVFPV